jgi:hypothetical protein
MRTKMMFTPETAREMERIERLFLDGVPHSSGGYDNPDTIMAPGGVEISLTDPLPEIMTIVRNMPRKRQRELLEQLKS